MIYNIPSIKFNVLEKKLNRIQRKCSDIVFNVLNKEKWVKDKKTHKAYKYVEIEVSGEYIINNWEFIGTLEFTENGNIIRSISNIEVPNEFKTCKPYCEHCNISRYRKDTYLIRNTKTNEFKQVGKSCLQEYTGMSAELVALRASLMLEINESLFTDNINIPHESAIESEVYKKYAYQYIKENGYNKENILNCLDKYIEENAVPNIDLTEIDKYIDNLNIEDNTYYWNAKLNWEKEYVQHRDYKLICSIINSYFKNIQEEKITQENRGKTFYVGNIGDKITIEVKSIRVTYSSYLKFGYNNYVETYYYEIIDNNDNTYIWKTSKKLDENVKRIEATIKEHKEFKGIKQTVITRGKINK